MYGFRPLALLVLSCSQWWRGEADLLEAAVSQGRHLSATIADLQIEVEEHHRMQKEDLGHVSGSGSLMVSPLSSVNVFHSEQHLKPSRSGPGPGGRLDIVIAHFDVWNEWQVREYWEKFLQTPKIKELDPYIYIYCQNPHLQAEKVKGMLASLVHRVEVIMLDNKGREGRVYLHHIVKHYDNLAQHTIFSQDLPAHWGEDARDYNVAIPRINALFRPETGILALSEVRQETCNDAEWPDNAHTPTLLMYQTYAMVTGDICPPEGFLAFYKGHFLVSAERVRGRRKELYHEMLHMLEAPNDHWIHRTHNATEFKSAQNPFLGHVYERTWSLLFDCFDPRGGSIQECLDCDKQEWQDCKPHACQCLDHHSRLTVSVSAHIKG